MRNMTLDSVLLSQVSILAPSCIMFLHHGSKDTIWHPSSLHWIYFSSKSSLSSVYSDLLLLKVSTLFDLLGFDCNNSVTLVQHVEHSPKHLGLDHGDLAVSGLYPDFTQCGESHVLTLLPLQQWPCSILVNFSRFDKIADKVEVYFDLGGVELGSSYAVSQGIAERIVDEQRRQASGSWRDIGEPASNIKLQAVADGVTWEMGIAVWSVIRADVTVESGLAELTLTDCHSQLSLEAVNGHPRSHEGLEGRDSSILAISVDSIAL
jgi:hypothetical protein